MNKKIEELEQFIQKIDNKTNNFESIYKELG